MKYQFLSVPESDGLLQAVADGSDLLTLDLSNVRFVKPALLAVVAAMAHSQRARHGEPARFVPPSLRDPRLYASRMLLGEVLLAEGVVETGLEPVQHRDRQQQQLCELTRFESSDEAAELVNLVQRRCDAAGYSHESAETLVMSIWELADNCLAHARVECGFLAAQVLPQPRLSLHFAVADGGVGIRASLADTQHERGDDRSAIEAAAHPRVTSVPSRHGSARGVGLPNLLEWVTLTGGALTIRSGTAAIQYGEQSNSSVPRAAASVVDEVGGTLVAGWVPC